MATLLDARSHLTRGTSDDDTYAAHAGLLGLPQIGHADLTMGPFAATGAAMAEAALGQTGQDCRIMPECISRDDAGPTGCDAGWVRIGWETGDCGVSALDTSTLLSQAMC